MDDIMKNLATTARNIYKKMLSVSTASRPCDTSFFLNCEENSMGAEILLVLVETAWVLFKQQGSVQCSWHT